MTRNYQDSRNVKIVAEAILRDYRELFEAHEAETERHSAEGHSNPYCVHGTYQWTDYDNICGGCENDETPNHWDAERFAEIAQEEAESFCADLQKRYDEIRRFWVGTEVDADPGSWISRKYVEFVSELHSELDEEMFKKLQKK